jgi:hypothetical protein
MTRRRTIRFAFALVALVATQAAWAHRDIVVNGQRPSPGQLAALDRWACGPIPNGRYWFNPYNGVWGYAGNPYPQGHIADRCRSTPRRSLSERGMLYSPYEHSRDGYRAY